MTMNNTTENIHAINFLTTTDVKQITINDLYLLQMKT